MRFVEAYGEWNAGRLTQVEAGQVLGMCERSFRRYLFMQIPVAHRRPPAASLRQIEKAARDRNDAIVQAHDTGVYSYQQIADHFEIHFTTVGRIVRGAR